MAWHTLVPIAISIVALVFSAITLWRSQFAPFKVVTSAGPMTFRIHSFRDRDKESWFLPHFAAMLSFTNAGAVPGHILSVRAIVRYPELPIDGAYEVFDCLGEFDARKYAEVGHGRLAMIDEAMTGDFFPFILLPKATETKFLIFSTRWDKPVRQKSILVEVEIQTDKADGWTKIEEWNFHPSAGMWHHVEGGGAYITDGSSNRIRRFERYPEDLHKYTFDSDLDTPKELDSSPSYEITPALYDDRDDLDR